MNTIGPLSKIVYNGNEKEYEKAAIDLSLRLTQEVGSLVEA